jgi:6-phosphogluconolactonase
VIQHTGSGADKQRQAGPHAHSVNVSKDNRFVIVGDLGLDEVKVYKLNAAMGTMTPNDPPFAKVAPASGPRHFNFHPNGKYGYVINEMALTVTAFKWDAKKGILKELQTISTLPEGADRKGASTAEILVHPSGKWLYGSNRGHDTIALFNINQADGKLTAVSHTSSQGKVPRNFRIDPTGNYLFAGNQNTNNMVLYRIDQTNGKLTPMGKQVEVGAPVSIRFLALKK